MPFDEVDAGRIVKLRQLQRSLEEKDQQVLETAYKLHREHFPAQKFPIERLDEILNVAHASLWNRLKASVKVRRSIAACESFARGSNYCYALLQTDGEPSASVVVEGETSAPTVAAPNGEGGLMHALLPMTTQQV